jgi:hypothetical protein
MKDRVTTDEEREALRDVSVACLIDIKMAMLDRKYDQSEMSRIYTQDTILDVDDEILRRRA